MGERTGLGGGRFGAQTALEEGEAWGVEEEE